MEQAQVSGGLRTADGRDFDVGSDLEGRPLVQEVSSSRIYEYARTLYGFDSKHVTQPGNGRAIESWYVKSPLPVS